MRYFVQNLYKSNLLNEDIKFNIYTQYYKHVSKLPEDLTQDLKTYFMLDFVIDTYREKMGSDLASENFFLYDLYNDLVHQHHMNDYNTYMNQDLLITNHYLNTIVMDTFHNRNNYIYYPFVMKRIRYFWRLLTPRQRVSFVSSMRSRFQIINPPI